MPERPTEQDWNVQYTQYSGEIDGLMAENFPRINSGTQFNEEIYDKYLRRELPYISFDPKRLTPDSGRKLFRSAIKHAKDPEDIAYCRHGHDRHGTSFDSAMIILYYQALNPNSDMGYNLLDSYVAVQKGEVVVRRLNITSDWLMYTNYLPEPQFISKQKFEQLKEVSGNDKPVKRELRRIVANDGCPATSILAAIYAGYKTEEIFALYNEKNFVQSLSPNIASLMPKEGDFGHRQLIGGLRKSLTRRSSKTGILYPVRESGPYFESVNQMVEAGLLIPESEDHKRVLQFHGVTEPAYAMAVLATEQEFAHLYAPQEYPLEPRVKYVNEKYINPTTDVVSAYMVFSDDDDLE